MVKTAEKTITILNSALKVIQAALSEYLKANPALRVGAKVFEVIASEYKKFTPDNDSNLEKFIPAEEVANVIAYAYSNLQDEQRAVLENAKPDELISQIDKNYLIIKQIGKIKNLKSELIKKINQNQSEYAGLKTLENALSSINSRFDYIEKNISFLNKKIDGQLKPEPLSPEIKKRLASKYRKQIIDYTQFVNLTGIPRPFNRNGLPINIQIPLDKIYIRIQAVEEIKISEIEENENRVLLQNKSQKSDSLNTHYLLSTLGEYFYRRGEVCQNESRPEPIDPEKALNKNNRIVILGAPGSGKSTLLLYLARKAAMDEDAPIPILVSLKEFAVNYQSNQLLNLRSFAIERVSNIFCDDSLRQFLENEIESGHILWLVDALDEARGCQTEAAKFTAGLPGKMILTSRPVGYKRIGMLQNLPHYEVLPLETVNVENFIQNWFSILAESQGENENWIKTRVQWLNDQIKKRARIQTLTLNPLMLTFLVLLAGKNPLVNLPEHRSILYRRYIEDLFRDWEHNRDLNSDEVRNRLTKEAVSNKSIHAVIQRCIYYIGWILHLAYYGGKPNDNPNRCYLIDSIRQYLILEWNMQAHAIAEIAFDFWQEAGLLEIWQLHSNDYYSFRHLTFQEYSTAWSIAEAWKKDKEKTWNFLCPRLHHYAWHEPILLLVGLMNQDDLDFFLAKLLEGCSPYEEYLSRDLILAGELLVEGAKSIKKNAIQKKLVEYIENSKYESILDKPFDLLANIDLNSVIQFVKNAKSEIRKCAVDALAKIESPEAIKALNGALEDEDEDVSLAAEFHLAYLKNNNEDISNVPDAEDISFKELYNNLDVLHLIKALKDPDSNVAGNAALALKENKDPRSIQPLIEAVIMERDWRRHVGESAAIALGEIKDPQSVEPLINALKHRFFHVRMNSSYVLGEIKDSRAVQPLIEALKDAYPEVRISAAQALGEIKDPRAVQALIEALKDIELNVRKSAVEALGEIEDPKAVQYLIEVLKNEDVEYNNALQSAAEAMGESPQDVHHLIDSLKQSYPNICDSSAFLYGMMGEDEDPETIELFAQALKKHRNPIEKRYDFKASVSAARALGKIKDSRAVKPLIEALKDEYPEVRSYAAQALGEIKDPQTIEPLIQSLEDEDSDVRNSIAISLMMIINQATINAVESMNITDRLPLLSRTHSESKVAMIYPVELPTLGNPVFPGSLFFYK